MSLPDKPAKTPIVVFLLTVITAFTLLWTWNVQSGLQCDELLYLRAIELGPVDGLLNPGSSHPPLGRLVFGSLLSADSPDWLLRIPSIVAALMTVATWFMILKRVFPETRFVIILLPLMMLERPWLEQGFQILPYAFHALFVSLHCLCWLRLIERSTWPRMVLFAITGAAPVWTHFYGINLLFADQIVWALLLWRQKSNWKTWLYASAMNAALVIPVLPLLSFYAAVEKPYAPIKIDHFPSYFVFKSNYIFSLLTINLPTQVPIVLAWCFAATAIVWRWLRPAGNKDQNATAIVNPSVPVSAIILLGVFLAGFPAAQAHSILSGKSSWTRYAIQASWVHWPLMILFLQHFWSPKAAYRVSVAAFAFCLLVLGPVERFHLPLCVFNDDKAIDCLATEAKPGDAYLAQDFDFWIGNANFDRLWFERYSPVEMPVITGIARGRFELAKKGLPFEKVDESIKRVWVYSSNYNHRNVPLMKSDRWELVSLRHALSRPLLLYQRKQNQTVPPNDKVSQISRQSAN